MEQLRRDLQSLQSKMAALSVAKPKRKRVKKRGGQMATTPAASSAISGTGTSKRRSRKQKQGCGPVGEGELVFRRRELIREAKATSVNAYADYVDLEPSNLKFLAGLYKNFERIQWLNVRISFKPAVGTTFGGLISYGFDYTSKLTALTRSQIAALTPNRSHACWVDSTNQPLAIPREMLQSRKWYVDSGDLIDQGPGRVLMAASFTGPANTMLGEFWIDYEVKLAGTRPQ